MPSTWDWDRARPVTASAAGGLGFDVALDDRLRESVRAALSQSSTGAGTRVNMSAVAASFLPPPGFPQGVRTVPHLENHDVVLWDAWEQRPRDLRIPKRSDPTNVRSWMARSRSRVATTWLMCAPGVPMLFMGQEILEDKPWSDDVDNWPQFLIWWDGLTMDRHMADFRRFVGDLVHLRRAQPALRGDGIHISQVHDDDRILVVHRWVEGAGHDVVVVSSLNERTLEAYPVDLPYGGTWREIFNSDYYDTFPNAFVAGNGGTVTADLPGSFGYPAAARMRIPANGAIVLVRA